MSKGRDRGTRRTAAQNHAQGEAQRGDLCRTARRTVRCGGCSFRYSRRDAHPLPFGGVRERRMLCLPLLFIYQRKELRHDAAYSSSPSGRAGWKLSTSDMRERPLAYSSSSRWVRS